MGAGTALVQLSTRACFNLLSGFENGCLTKCWRKREGQLESETQAETRTGRQKKVSHKRHTRAGWFSSVISSYCCHHAPANFLFTAMSAQVGLAGRTDS